MSQRKRLYPSLHANIAHTLIACVNPPNKELKKQKKTNLCGSNAYRAIFRRRVTIRSQRAAEVDRDSLPTHAVLVGVHRPNRMRKPRMRGGRRRRSRTMSWKRKARSDRYHPSLLPRKFYVSLMLHNSSSLTATHFLPSWQMRRHPGVRGSLASHSFTAYPYLSVLVYFL